MKTKLFLLLSGALVFLMLLSSQVDIQQDKTVALKAWYIQQIEEAAQAFTFLEKTIDANDVARQRQALVDLRMKLKHVESLTAYFDGYAYPILFSPNLPKIEYEPGEPAEVRDPIGLQRLEELMVENATKEVLDVEMHQINRLILQLVSYAKQTDLSDEHVFLALKLQLIRIQTTGISGFDTPVFSQSLEEQASALEGVKHILQFYNATRVCQPTLKSLDRAISYLQKNSQNFDDFNRAFFIRAYIQPLFELLMVSQKELGISNVAETKTNGLAINQNSSSIYDANFLNPYYYHKTRLASHNEGIEDLGRTLFFDPILSANTERACASCHMPEFAFAENEVTSLALDGKKRLSRNAPTLINSAFQTKFQLDGRADFPERQFHQVLFNPDEMGSTENDIVSKLNQSEEYQTLFHEAFGEDKDINFSQVKYALGAYTRSLVALNSPFDVYMRDPKAKIPDSVERGFNLFMGKAACSTCHFPPVFNGTVPPMYSETEIEVIGVTISADFDHPQIDSDVGAYGNSNEPAQKFGFKTPTLRNADLTAPYMHNGAYATLQQVIDFYNRGGAAGMGVDLPNQTLPSDSLGLTSLEVNDLIAFIQSLSDTSNVSQKPSSLPRFADKTLNTRKVGGEY